jgi:hypothetical protein
MSVIRVNAPRYRVARKKGKSQILDELLPILHYHRKYLAGLLRSSGKVVFTPAGTRVIADPTVSLVSHRGRKKCYAPALVPYLKLIWQLASTVSSVHLVAFIRANRSFLFRHPGLVSIPIRLKRQLLTISHATIDRLLAQTRKKLLFYRPGYRNPHAAWLKQTIPVQSYAQKPIATFGYLEVDTVFHAGSSTRGQFAATLDVTEIETGWTELAVLPNLAQVWTERALRRILHRLPFTASELHSDNGHEFINRRLTLLAKQFKLSYTRSRVLHKNDAPFVESKNATLVRAYVGRRRYDTAAEIRILKRLMPKISLKHNLFMPTMKRDRSAAAGSHRRFTTETPYQRLLSSNQVSARQKTALRRLRKKTDYFRLAAEIDQLGLKLDRVHQAKYIQKA